MIVISAQNLNQATIKACQLLLEKGVARQTRGYDCIELKSPVLIEITNPYDRYINIPGRGASKTLPFAESLAILSGINSMDLYSGYVPNMIQYSDDGLFQRAGYGPRLRGFIGVAGNYENTEPKNSIKNNNIFTVNDQFNYVYQVLKKDPNSRQAVMSITDPANDQLDIEGNLVQTKDIPCCRLLQFMLVDGKLDLTVYFRSNDVLFGFQQVNVFNNTFMLECMANLLGLKVGKYYHVANNLHYYADKNELVELMASQEVEKYSSFFPDWLGYDSLNMDLEEFDRNLAILETNRLKIKLGSKQTTFWFSSDLFRDWLRVFERFHNKEKSIYFKNPYLNLYFGNKILNSGSEYVKVWQGNHWEFYEVFKPQAYMAQCIKDGKKAVYLGRADKYGYLNQ
jgi:thymidylate synthase